MNFYIKAHQHKAATIIRALRDHRYNHTMTIRKADLVFLDYTWHGVWAGIEHVRMRGEVLAAEQAGKPLFLYPHSARPDVPYDFEPYHYEQVKANFVFAPGHAEVLKMIDYPCPVEVMGYPYTEPGSFQQSNPSGKIKVLFGPIHPIGRNLPDDEKELNARTYETLLALTDKIDLFVRHIHKLEYNGLWWDERVTFYPAACNGSTTQMLEADLVIGAYTFASMASAVGKPLISMGDKMRSHNTPMGGKLVHVRNWEKYAEYKAYPFNVEDAVGNPASLLSMMENAMAGGAAVDEWRRKFIGEAFDADRFVKTVESYL